MKVIPIALASLLAAGGALAQGDVSAKALFYGTDGSVMSVATQPIAPESGTQVATTRLPAKAPPGKLVAARKPVPLGAGYFIRLKKDDGTIQDVLSSRVFHSGERFQLGVKVNKPSFVFIYNRDDTGKLTRLYPQPGQSNLVDAMGVVFFPAEGSFQFDGNPGIEQLLVYLSPQPADPIEKQLASAPPDLVSDPTRLAGGACAAQPARQSGAALAVADVGVASKGIAYTADSCAVATVASKGIVFSDDPAPAAGGQVATYVVKHQAKPTDPLHLQLKLVHR